MKNPLTNIINKRREKRKKERHEDNVRLAKFLTEAIITDPEINKALEEYTYKIFVEGYLTGYEAGRQREYEEPSKPPFA